jgi:hypothetical protein
MPYAHYTAEEVAARGEALYEQQIRAQVEATHQGEFVVVDIETGDYEIDPDDLVATKRALAKRTAGVRYERTLSAVACIPSLGHRRSPTRPPVRSPLLRTERH